MTRAFSLTSDALSYFVGFALLHSDQVVIVSPWLSDVTLNLPLNDRFEGRQVSLVEAITELSEKDIRLFVRSGESHNEYIRSRLPTTVEFREVDDLHAKAVVSSEFVYMGSANITRGGLTLHRELCEIVENDHDSAEAYVREHLGFDI